MARDTSRRAAQRAVAARVREARPRGARYRPLLPTAVREPSKRAASQFALDVQEGRIPRPAAGTPEARQLARMASLASHGKADPSFEDSFKEYWYHKKDQPNPDEEEEIDYGLDEEEEDDEE